MKTLASLSPQRDFRFKVRPFRYTWKDFFYHAFLITMGFALIFLVVIAKAKTAQEYFSHPLVLIYTLFVTSFELSRLLGAMMFRHVDASLHGYAKHEEQTTAVSYEPTVTFVIPCKNEEQAITKTVEKCFQAHYPKDKLEVIVINDGSTDGTYKKLLAYQKKQPTLKIIHWEENRGKRHAMAAGFREATGEIVIQLDSDSYIDPTTFAHFVEPFLHPEIGAVCAHADPENADKNLLTRMQAAYYFLSFRILKAAESTFMVVMCCSGCSSAYRRSIVMPILDEWEAETFLGLPVTWGDDRALTNWVIKSDYKTIYTDRVQAYTICPESLKTFLKQQARWKKGWFVNSIFASKFMYRKHPFVAFTYFFPLIFITLATPFVATKALIFDPITRGTSPLYYLLGVFLVAGLITVFYRFVSRGNKYWPYVFIWSALNTVVLSFILFFALLGIQNRKWGTR